MTDAYLLAWYQSSNDKIKNMSMIAFADRLAWDLIYNLDQREAPSLFISSSAPSLIDRCSPASAISSVSGFSFTEPDPKKHLLVSNFTKEPCGRVRRRQCEICGKKGMKICSHEMCIKKGPLFLLQR